MADRLTSEQRHYNMSRIRSANTKPELVLRHALWQGGYRYRINDRKLPGKPDIVLPKYRTVIFVHGCFWHGHIGCERFVIPQTNTEFWSSKIHKNQERDQDCWRQLEAKGWNIIVVWECEITKKRLLETISHIQNELRSNLERENLHDKERREVRALYFEERKRRQNLLNSYHEELSKKD